MGLDVNITWDWETVPVQYSLFADHVHSLRVESIRIQSPTRLLIKWKGTTGDELQDRVIAETFDLAMRRGREKFKDFLFSMFPPTDGAIIDLEPCIGRVTPVIVVRRRAGQSWRWHILHHSLDWNEVDGLQESRKALGGNQACLSASGNGTEVLTASTRTNLPRIGC